MEVFDYHSPVRFRFGRFVLSPARRVLRRDGRDVAIIPRYFDLLVLLVSQRDRAVTRQEIFDRVWADVVVSDGALTQAVRTLRRVLGDDPREPRYIRTVSRHGYQFVFAPVEEEPDDGEWMPGEALDPDGTVRIPAQARDPFERPLAVLLRQGDHGGATEDERYDAAVALHELGTAEALRRLDARDADAGARALLREARWDVPGAGDVPVLAAHARLGTIRHVLTLRLRRAARLASARWASAAGSAALAGVVAGIAGAVALHLVPGSDTGLDVAYALALVGAAAGAVGGAGIGAGLAGAEAVARSARGLALAAGGAAGGTAIAWAAHHTVRALLSDLFGRDLSALPGAPEGLVLGGALGAGYALATRRLPQGGMAAPRGAARWRVTSVTALTTAAGAVALAAAGRHLVGSSLDVMAGAFAGSQVGLDPLARLLGEDSLRPVTRALVSAFEGAMFGAGVAFGLTRRPRLDR